MRIKRKKKRERDREKSFLHRHLFIYKTLLSLLADKHIYCDTQGGPLLTVPSTQSGFKCGPLLSRPPDVLLVSPSCHGKTREGFQGWGVYKLREVGGASEMWEYRDPWGSPRTGKSNTKNRKGVLSLSASIFFSHREGFVFFFHFGFCLFVDCPDHCISFAHLVNINWASIMGQRSPKCWGHDNI